MTERAPDSILSGINIAKTIAGALAAVCAAVVGSFLGVAGTLAGAAVASIIGSVGTEIYERSLHRGAKKLQTLTPAFIKAPAAVGTPAVAAATEDDSPSHTVAPERRIRWSRVAMIAGALFVLAMGSLTIVEAISHKSIASTVGNNTGATSTWGGIVNPGPNAKPTPSRSESPSSPSADSTSPSGTSTTTSTPPTPVPSSAVTSAPEVAPTTGAPATTQAPTPDGRQNQPQVPSK